MGVGSMLNEIDYQGKQIVERIEKVKRDLNINYKHFSDLIDMTYNTFYKYRTGYYRLSMEILYEICETMQVSVEWMLTGYGPQWRDLEGIKKRIEGGRIY